MNFQKFMMRVSHTVIEGQHNKGSSCQANVFYNVNHLFLALRQIWPDIDIDCSY
jgi:hypothetical protein